MNPLDYVEALCSTADGVYVVDTSQRVIGWNKGAERILGYGEADVLSLPCYELIAGRTRPEKPWCQPNCKIHDCALSRTPVENFDLLTRTKGGEDIWLNISVISPADGGQPVTAHVIRDITREKRAGYAIEQFLIALGLHGMVREKPDSRGHKLIAAARSPALEVQNVLSSREVEVLTLLAEGLSTKAVSQRLRISHYTARNHIQNILSKLDLHSKAQAVSYAFKKGLL